MRLTARFSHYRDLLAMGGAVYVLDQATKWAVLEHLPLHTFKTVLAGFFNLVHVRNTGAAFSLLSGASPEWRQPVLIGVSLAALGVILILYRQVGGGDAWTKRALALIFGGALGNVTDRLRFGEVIDFLDFYWRSYHWPAFNIADSAISVGAGVLLLLLLRAR
jgi:signal peptidase II